MTEIKTKESYRREFPEGKARKALECALDIRKFEIELYWKRTTYFWALIAAAFGGYFALAGKSDSTLSVVVGCIGFLLSLGWYLVNRGSKYWQSNWERHVDTLENDFIGPLYKTTISSDEFAFFKFWAGYPYSVSKINQLISLFITIIWIGLVVKAMPNLDLACLSPVSAVWLMIAITLIFSVLLLSLGLGGSQKNRRNINFFRSGQE